MTLKSPPLVAWQLAKQALMLVAAPCLLCPWHGDGVYFITIVPSRLCRAFCVSWHADPLYFDFISFSQYSTISREMGTPLRLFNEYQEVCPPGAGEDDPCEAGTQVVQRPEQFADDAQLPQYFFTTAGRCLLVWQSSLCCLGRHWCVRQLA
jgi:hypothetical protein